MNVLILDDVDTDLDVASRATSALGHTVQRTRDPEHFFQTAREWRVDLQVVDHALGNAQDTVGLRDGPEIVVVSAAESGHVPTVFLTNWGPDCAQRFAAYDPRLVAAVVEKPPSHSFEVWRDKLSTAIEEITARPDFGDPAPLGVSAGDLMAEFFRLPPDEFRVLSEDDRDDLESEVSLEIYERLSAIWTVCNADWLMLQRIADVITAGVY